MRPKGSLSYRVMLPSQSDTDTGNPAGLNASCRDFPDLSMTRTALPEASRSYRHGEPPSSPASIRLLRSSYLRIHRLPAGSDSETGRPDRLYSILVVRPKGSMVVVRFPSASYSYSTRRISASVCESLFPRSSHSVTVTP